MVHFNRFQPNDEQRKEELIRNIEHAIAQLTVNELEALYYDIQTKQHIKSDTLL